MSDFLQGALLIVLGAILGFLLTLLERKRAEREADKRRSAAWQLTPNGSGAWIMTNIGDAEASDIQLQAEGSMLVGPKEPFALKPGEDRPVYVATYAEDEPHLVIQWTSHRGDPVEPMRRYLA